MSQKLGQVILYNYHVQIVLAFTSVQTVPAFFKSLHIVTSYDMATKPSESDTLSSATEADNATLHGEVAGVSPMKKG